MKPEPGRQYALKSVLLVVAVFAVLFASLGAYLKQQRRLRVFLAEEQSIQTAYGLRLAFESYIRRNGWLPPSDCDSDIKLHLLWLCPRATFSDEDVTRILELDDAEFIVFWLRGDYNQMVGRQSYWEYEFDPKYLVDIDNDGFQEYTATDGSTFYYRDRTVIVRCTAIERDIIAVVDDSEASITLEEMARYRQHAGDLKWSSK